jgi:hypothetical protein
MYLNVHLIPMVPNIKGITEVQRKGKKAFIELNKKETGGKIFLADRNKIFAVVLSLEEYRKLNKNRISDEDMLWIKASQTALDFWNDPSNDAYEKLR